MTEAQSKFTQAYKEALQAGSKLNNPQVAKLAARFGITLETEVKEFAELAIVLAAKEIAERPLPMPDRFALVVALYESQVNLNTRTSNSMMLQQYSTPAPISFLAGAFVKAAAPSGSFFEPTAGNGLLCHYIPSPQVVVNEIDKWRLTSLKSQAFKKILTQDATKPFGFDREFDGILANPPFGDLKSTVLIGPAAIGILDHLICLRALDGMKDDGRAALIIGGHNEYDKDNLIKSGKNRVFIRLLYHLYNVVDVINIDSKKLYSRQGTSFDVRMILIDGRAKTPGHPPLYDPERNEPVTGFYDLYKRVAPHLPMKKNKLIIKKAADVLIKIRRYEEQQEEQGLGAPYLPTSRAESLIVHTPDSMEHEIHSAVARLKKVVGSLDEYVMDKLQYRSIDDLHEALKAEQVDAVALAVYNIEQKKKGIIIADQTGIGKGRQAAGVIRYAVLQGYKPWFITEAPNLFSDMYRDLVDIGSGDLVPFILNEKEPKTIVRDKEGEEVYSPLTGGPQKRMISELLKRKNAALVGYDMVFTTYSQFQLAGKKTEVLLELAKENILILDEAHNASGEGSARGARIKQAVADTNGCVFLSATYAKRPDNMPLYALKTAMGDANLSPEALVDAIGRGGVALQEVISAQLVKEGQLVRRERKIEDLKVEYTNIHELPEKDEDKAKMKSLLRSKADICTEIIRDIIMFQQLYITGVVESKDEAMKKEYSSATQDKNRSNVGVDSPPLFSRVFHIINLILFSLKAEEVGKRAVYWLKLGYKPVITFANTMESYIDNMVDAAGEPVKVGQNINTNFSAVLHNALNSVMTLSIDEGWGKEKIKVVIELHELPMEGQMMYKYIYDKINKASTGMCLSPIDVVAQVIKKAGYTTEEVTGREKMFLLSEDYSWGKLASRDVLTVNEAFRLFNENEVDCLMINQKGATGASAHAVFNEKVRTLDEVKPRIMLNLQAELDINKQVQKMGRINRTGQVKDPRYEFISSPVPAETRLMMMLQRKLKSLDANTSSNQKNSEEMMNFPDFLNKIGDGVVVKYLIDHPEINMQLGNPASISYTNGAPKVGNKEEAAGRSTGRVAILPSEEQEKFYTAVIQEYNNEVEYLKQVGEYDLEMETEPLDAKTESKEIITVGKDGGSVFGGPSYMEVVTAKNLRKPLTKEDLEQRIAETTEGNSAQAINRGYKGEFAEYEHLRLRQDLADLEITYGKKLNKLETEWKLRQESVELEQEDYDKQEEKEEKLEAWYQKAQSDLKASSEGRKYLISTILDFFWAGRSFRYPIMGGSTMTFAKGVVIGISIDRKKPNPFAPSNIAVKLAIANSLRYIVLKASGESGKLLSAIMGNSHSLRDDYRYNWQEVIRTASESTTTRYIVTGNLLQAVGRFKNGKLVSYTTDQIVNGKPVIKKGFLLNESYVPKSEEGKAENVTVPIKYCRKVIASLITGQFLFTSDKLSFMKSPDPEVLKLFAPGTKTEGGHIFQDADIIALLQGDGQGFVKKEKNMVGEMHMDQLDRLIALLQSKFTMSVELSRDQFNMIKGDIPDFDEEPTEDEISQQQRDKEKRMRLVKIKAKAVMVLQMQLKYEQEQEGQPA